MAKQSLNNDEQFYKICLSFFRAVKAKKTDMDTGELIEVTLKSDHKIMYSYFVHTQQFCEKEGKPFEYSIDHMADFCGINRQKFMKRITDLEKLGLIMVHRKGNGRNNAYTVNTLDCVELISANGKLSPSRQRDYDKQRSKRVRNTRPSEINAPKHIESENLPKEETAQEKKPVVSNICVDTKDADFAAFSDAPLKIKNDSNYIEENEGIGSFSNQERSSSEDTDDWHFWDETISIAAMSLDKLPITDQGKITSHGQTILKKYGIDPATKEASWFCRELLENALLGGKAFA